MELTFFKPEIREFFESKYGSDNPGGAEKQIYYLGEEISKRNDIRVSVIENEKNVEGSKEQVNSVCFHGFDIPEDGQNIVTKCWKYLKIFGTTPSEILFLHASNSVLFLAALFGKVRSTQVVYWTAYHWNVDRDEILNRLGWLHGSLYILGLHLCDTLLVQNVEDKQTLADEFGLESSVLRMGQHIPAKPSIQDKKHIMWVATSKPWKNPHRFIDLAASIPSEEFIMVCNRSDADLYRSVKQRASTVENLTHLENVPPDEMEQMYQNAKVFVNTSDEGEEGFPNTFVEAAKYATPIVSLNENPDGFITESNCGFVADGDVGRLRDRVMDILDRESLFRDMSSNSYRYARQNHNIERVSDDLVDLVRHRDSSPGS